MRKPAVLPLWSSSCALLQAVSCQVAEGAVRGLPVRQRALRCRVRAALTGCAWQAALSRLVLLH